ncbi:HD domain-containing protein [Seonamhaeicola marinus]|uniref:HD domain-containing protein n=1 Tax=Seonamhaeicola marinus TaxID=1912246 RepID=UPI001FE9546D|nr:hypothetical protein [Seonamhaeicola marinus]
MIQDLRLNWLSLACKYGASEKNANALWKEIENQYSQKHRYYHNLSHIENLLILAESCKERIKNFDAVLFAVWYHDIIYSATKKDNEVQSANYAQERLTSLNLEKGLIETIKTLIISTQKHEIILTENNDNALLLDMDLSILGSSWEDYHKYLKNIRKEYAIFPNFMYRKGRKKVLQHFLERDTLYFTAYFQSKFEAQARKNLNKEIELL